MNLDDLDFKFDDFDFGVEYTKIDICGLVKKMKGKKRRLISFNKEKNQIEHLVTAPPSKNEVFKLLSVGGGFSSLGIIKYVAELEGIEEMYVSTFRIGKKHFEELMKLKSQGHLNEAHFITSQTQERVDDVMVYKGKEYNYYDFIVSKCQELKWSLKAFDNHSKLILMKTPKNYYVVETSSNLNENPKMEQFSWENDKELYEWYLELFKELLK